MKKYKKIATALTGLILLSAAAAFGQTAVRSLLADSNLRIAFPLGWSQPAPDKSGLDSVSRTSDAVLVSTTIVISEFRTRGPNGANDEFIEICNISSSPVDISGYRINGSNNAGTTSTRATVPANTILAAGARYLFTNTATGGYSGAVPGNTTYATGITDDGGIAVLNASLTVIDQVGMSSGSAYKEGTVLTTTTTNVNQSYERKSGNMFANLQDTDVNSSDFQLNAGSSNPQNNSLSASPVSLNFGNVALGSSSTLPVTLTNNSAFSVTVGTPTIYGDDFAEFSSGDGTTIPANSTTTIQVTFTPQSLAAKSAVLNIKTSASSIAVPLAGTGTRSLPNLSINDVSQNEGSGGTTTYTFTVSLSAPAGASGVTFDIATADGTATTAGSDYVQKSLTGQTIAAGNSSYTFDVTVNGDTAVETNETFFVNVSNVTGATVTDGQGQGTIVNDDAAQPGTLQFSTTSYTVGEGGGSATFTVTRTGGSNGAVSATYALTNGTATGGASCGSAGIDFVNTGGTIGFADGDAADKTFTVAICDDAIYEGSQNFTATLSLPTGGAVLGANNPATATITENDGAPQFTISDAAQSEGNSGTTNLVFSVSKTGATDSNATVDVNTVGVTATSGTDYAGIFQTLTFLPGDTSKTVTVAINGDTEIEPDETFDVILSNAVNATIADNQGVGTIINDDFPPPTVSFDSTIYKEDESQTALLFVNRTGDLSGTTSVHFSTPVPQNLGVAGATGGASCAMGIDYITASGTLVFAPDVAQQEIQVQLCGDALREGFEYFPVTLSNVTNGTLGEISTASVEINDTASQFVNGESIGIGTSGDAYESTIEVAGAPSTIGSVRVTLYDFDYYQADNVDVLLVGPQGQKMLLMADAGGSGGLSDPATVTFDDTAGRVLPNEGTIATGKYEPTTWEPGQTSFTAPAPAGPYTEPGSAVGGTPSLGSVFGGTNPNGTWRLYIRDDNNTFQQLGIGGSVAGGWGLSFVAPTAAGVSVSGLVRSGKMPIANVQVMISGGNLTQPMFTKTSSFGNYTFEGLTAGQTYVVTVVSRRYTFPQSAIVVTTVDNVSNADFEAEDR